MIGWEEPTTAGNGEIKGSSRNCVRREPIYKDKLRETCQNTYTIIIAESRETQQLFDNNTIE